MATMLLHWPARVPADYWKQLPDKDLSTSLRLLPDQTSCTVLTSSATRSLYTETPSTSWSMDPRIFTPTSCPSWNQLQDASHWRLVHSPHWRHSGNQDYLDHISLTTFVNFAITWIIFLLLTTTTTLTFRCNLMIILD